MNRRTFLHKAGIAANLVILPSTFLSWDSKLANQQEERLRFGIVADVHHGMIPDTQERLETFMEQAIEREVDFVLQLGDFCHPKKKSKAFLDVWNQYKGPRYHVLGNHDMDLGSKAEIMDLWEMPSNHYTFDAKGIRFIVLDANFLYQDGQMEIEGVRSQWLAPSPEEAGVPKQVFGNAYSPIISDYSISF